MEAQREYSLPLAANDNEDALHDPVKAYLELHRLRRGLMIKDKTGYSASDWRRFVNVLQGLDEAISLIQPYA
jgi:hypothetical protein